MWTLNDLPDTQLGKVGEKIDSLCLNYFKDRNIIVMMPDDEVALQAVATDMAQSVSYNLLDFS